MLIVCVGATSLSAGGFAWSGRRHDEDGVGPTHGQTAEDLFEAVYRTVSIGEQVALGVQCRLTVAVPDDASTIMTGTAEAGLDHLANVLTQMGTWRPWTTATTALATWKATTSILLFEAASEPEYAVPALFTRMRTPDEARMGIDPGPVVNLAAEAALRAHLVIDPGEVSEPPLIVG